MTHHTQKKYSDEVERRLAELDAKGPYGRERFNNYVDAVAHASRSSRAAPTSLTNEQLFEGYDNATADFHRYGRPSLDPYGTSARSEWNFAIVTFAGERMQALQEEILRRMKK